MPNSSTDGSQDLFKRLLEAAPDAILLLDRHGKIIIVNAQMERLFGYTRNELIGREVELLVPDRFRQGHAGHRQRYFTNPGVRPMGAGLELYGRRRDGTEFPVEISLSPMETDEGPFAMAAIRDITDRKRAEAGREQLASIVDYSDDAIIGKTLDGIIVNWNRGAERLYGYSAEEVIGGPVSILLPPGRVDELAAIMQRLVHGEEIHHEETLRRRKDGTLVNVSLTISPIKNSFGQVTGASTIARDITERREAEDRFRALMESAPDAMVIVDQHGRIVLVNAQTERLFGYPRHELSRQPVEVLIPERYHSGHTGHRERYFANPSVRPMGAGLELYGRRKDGAEFPVEISLSPIEVKGERLVVSAIRDITDRKQAEAQRVRLYQEEGARRQAEAANRMKDEFLVTLSHELRTPLNAILGWSQLLRRRAVSEARTDQALETIERNARVQQQLIEDLLDVSRIVSGKLRLQFRIVDVFETVTHAIDVVRPSAAAKEIELKINLNRRVSAISGDPDRLQQAMWNLLSNALKFTPHGGCVEVVLDETTEGVRISVKDSGEGIPPEFLPHIFNRFSQADSTTTRTHGGLGLGLAIARHLVEAHGGSISARSAGKQKGATFTIILPPQMISPVNEKTAPRPAVEKGALRGCRVLVVDDRADELELFQTVLENDGADVSTANCAAAAIELFEKRRPDVLVTDIAMPEESGYELLRRLRSRPGDKSAFVPAIAITAHARVEDRDRALAAGFQAYISKPVDPWRLIQTVAQIAGRAPDGNG